MEAEQQEEQSETMRLKRQLHVMQMKQLVATELTHYAESIKSDMDIPRRIVKLFDQPDGWWRQRDHYTLNQWLSELRNSQ